MPSIPTFVEYKFRKAVHDLSRAHEVLMAASTAARANPVDADVHSHKAFKALDNTLDDLRFVADDMVKPIMSAWDRLVHELLVSRLGSTQFGSLKKGIAKLQAVDPDSHAMLEMAWESPMRRLNELRNGFEHDDFWTFTFGVGQGDGPFLMDLLHQTPHGEVSVLSDARSAIRILHAANARWSLGHSLAPLKNPCPECFG